MSIIEENVLMSHLNEEGNRVLDFPITKSECIDGLDDHVERLFKGIDSGTLHDIGVLETSEGGN